MVKHLHVMRETRVQSLGREVPLEKEMATHSSISEALFQEDSRFLFIPPIRQNSSFGSYLVGRLLAHR